MYAHARGNRSSQLRRIGATDHCVVCGMPAPPGTQSCHRYSGPDPGLLAGVPGVPRRINDELIERAWVISTLARRSPDALAWLFDVSQVLHQKVYSASRGAARAL
jgi:hypothetical protein